MTEFPLYGELFKLKSQNLLDSRGGCDVPGSLGVSLQETEN